MKTKHIILILTCITLFYSSVFFITDWAVYGVCPLKSYFAKEIKENGICHVKIDEHFSVYFEPEKYTPNELCCFLYFDGKKTGIYSFNSIFENKYTMVRFLLSHYYYGYDKNIDKSKHYEPCK